MTAINNSCKIHYLWEPYTGFFHIPQLRTKRNMPDFIMYHSTVGTRLCIKILWHFLWCLIIRSCLLVVRLLFSSHSSSFWCDSLWLHRVSTCSCLLFCWSYRTVLLARKEGLDSVQQVSPIFSTFGRYVVMYRLRYTFRWYIPAPYHIYRPTGALSELRGREEWGLVECCLCARSFDWSYSTLLTGTPTVRTYVTLSDEQT